MPAILLILLSLVFQLSWASRDACKEILIRLAPVSSAPAERMVAYLSGQEEKLSYWESTGSNGSSSQLARILRDGSLYRQLRLLASEYIGNLALLGQDPEMEELVGEENDRI